MIYDLLVFKNVDCGWSFDIL